MNDKPIPLSIPSITGNEWQYLKDCLDTGWVSSAGKFVEEFEKRISEYTGAACAVACVNGTAALQVSLKLCGVSPGDEVIVPTLTFIAPVNSIRYNGAEPIFMDADKHYNIDIEKTIQFIKEETLFKQGVTVNRNTGKTISALVPVHVWGNAVWLDDLIQLCRERNIAIVEDASESLGTWYSKGDGANKHTGTIGNLGCLSFNGNKVITSGGGGMIISDNENLIEKARYLTTQAKNDPIQYIHNEVGYNFRLSNIQAALGVAQLEQLDGILKKKKNIFQKYINEVDKISGLSIAAVPNYAQNNHWLNILQIDSDHYGRTRDDVLKNLKREGIESRPVWYPNHLQKPYWKCQAYKVENAQHLVQNSLCLPSSSQLSEDDICRIARVLNG